MNYESKSNIAWLSTVLSYLIQLVLIVVTTLFVVPPFKEPNWVVCLILLFPLLPFMPFLLRRSIRAAAGISFLVLAYFMFAVTNAMDPNYGLLAQLELFNTILLFVFSMMFTRWEQRRLGISITR